jgi:1-acyl-sn-glycerol-3-phosphate acyltransferase
LNARAPLEKPRAEVIRPELTRLPDHSPGRKLFRRLTRGFCRLILLLLTRTKTRGLENFPPVGPALLVSNHLGDADGVLGMAFFPESADALAKMELYDFPLVSQFMEAYGVIWVHRGMPDRRALHAAFKGLAEGRFLAMAPEGRESITGALEEGTGGAAYLAWKAGVPVVPVTFTGTENSNVFSSFKRLRRPELTLTVGPMFRLENLPDRREAVDLGTELIMKRLAQQLPEKYRGVYQVE